MSALSTTEIALGFAALGDETRLLLLRRLGEGESFSIKTLSSKETISRQGVTKHLRVLERAGIVQSERIGRETHFRVRREQLESLQVYLQQVSQQWDDALQRLKNFVEAQDASGRGSLR